MPIFHNISIALLIFSGLLFNYDKVNGSLEKNDGNELECQVGRALRKQVKPTPLDGMCLKDIVTHLSRRIRSIGNDELGLTKFQEMLDQLEFTEVPTEFESEFESLVDNLTRKIYAVFNIFDRTEHSLYPIFNPNPLFPNRFKSQQMQKSPTAPGKIVNLCSEIENALSFDLEDNRWKQLRVFPNERPGKICGEAGPIRNIVSILLNHCDKRRNVIVLMEHGTFMSDDDIILARATAKTIVEMLSDTDFVTFIGLADESTIYCKDALVQATDANKYELIRRIDATVKTDTNQSIAIDFKSLTSILDDDAVIIHVTNTLKDVSNVENIVKIISSNKLTVHLRTALILSDLKPVVNVEEAFINESIATLPTNNPLGYDIARLFANIKCENVYKKVYWLSDVFLDTSTKTLCISVAHETDTALIALNIKLGEFVDVITHFNAGRNNYAILFNKKGVVWMHKSFPRLETLAELPVKVYLHDIENIDETAVAEMIERSEGMMELMNKLKKKLTIRWKHLSRFGLIICVVSEEKKIKRSIVKSPPPLPPHILHHRLDLETQVVADSAEFCMNRRSIISLSTGTLYVPPWSSKLWRENPASLMNLQSYMKYIKDTTQLVNNPGLDKFVRPDAALIAQILHHFTERHLNSPSKMYILRRYVAAVESDVIALFPGMALDSSLDPKRRVWYRKAIDHPGKIVITGPYLDAGGGGYILSLSQTLYESQSAALQTHTHPVVAVATMDITMGYVTRLLRDMLPFCNDSMIRCFLMDDRGYLVSHPSLLEPGAKLEQQHLTHKELLVANDVLNHELFIKKKVCTSYLDGTIQRYYQFNTSLGEVLTNIIHGEHCVKYQIAAVPDTNLFFGVINETCALSAFCPCSTMDRLCLNCKRMEQTECECPCECSIYSSDIESNNTSDVESCAPPYEQGIVPATRLNRVTNPSHLILNQCPMTNCKSYITESECLGIVGCQWCSVDGDGETVLTNPFCSDVYLCFKGVLGSILPYSDGPYNTQAMGDNVGREWPSVGPVAGGILAIVLIFVITLFCYRLHSVQSGVEHQCLHLHGSPGAHRMTHLDIGIGGGGGIDGDPIELDRTKHHMDSLLNEGILPISPYRVATNYRRPPGGDSDHGYSTMTPHDDTEQQSFAEPLLVVGNNMEQEFIHHTTLSSSSSPTTTTTTHLESPHRVLVPVTVHRNMETNYC